MSQNTEKIIEKDSAQKIQEGLVIEGQGNIIKLIQTTKNATIENQDDEFPQGSIQLGNNFFLDRQKYYTQTDYQSDLELSFDQKMKFQHQEVLLKSLHKYINESQFKDITEGAHQFSKFNLREQLNQFQFQCLENIKKTVENQDYLKIMEMVKIIHHRENYFKLFQSLLKFIPLSLSKSLFFFIRQIFIFAQRYILQLNSLYNPHTKQFIEAYIETQKQTLMSKLQSNPLLQQLYIKEYKQDLKNHFEELVKIWSYSFLIALQGYYQNKYFKEEEKQGQGQLFHFSDNNFWGEEPEWKPSKKIKKNEY